MLSAREWDRFIFATPLRALVFAGSALSAWVGSYVLRSWVWPQYFLVPAVLVVHYVAANLLSDGRGEGRGHRLLTWREAQEATSRTPARTIVNVAATVLTIAACAATWRTFWIVVVIPANTVAWYLAANLLAARDTVRRPGPMPPLLPAPAAG